MRICVDSYSDCDFDLVLWISVSPHVTCIYGLCTRKRHAGSYVHTSTYVSSTFEGRSGTWWGEIAVYCLCTVHTYVRTYLHMNVNVRTYIGMGGSDTLPEFTPVGCCGLAGSCVVYTVAQDTLLCRVCWTMTQGAYVMYYYNVLWFIY